jgi:heavy metal sensor kinase
MKQRKPWQSLRLRLVAWYSLLAGLSLTVSEGFMYLEFRRSLLKQIDNTLEVITIQALKNIDDEVNALSFDPRQDAPVLASLLDEAGVSVDLLDQDGSVNERFGESLILSTEASLNPGFKTIANDDGRWRVYTQEISPRSGRPAGWLRVSHSLQSVDATLRDVLEHHLLEIPLILGMVGLGGLFVANRALKPIGQITRMAEQVRVNGDLTQRICYQGAADELERLATMFDEMLDSLQATFEREKQFTADASHELRTPLTAIKGRLYVTLSQERTVENYQETLQAIEQEVDRLIHLSSDLLLLSQLEQYQLDLNLEPIDLSDLLAAIAEQVQPLAELHHLKFSTHIVPNLNIQGSPDHLIRLFLNLLDNAMKYTSKDGQVNLTAALCDRSVRVTLSDTGMGIPPEHLAHLFERFYRVEKSRSRTIEGTGLGLAIAQEIVHRHQGAIAVQSKLGQGTIFTVTLPKQ